jgi:hypothetical protein
MRQLAVLSFALFVVAAAPASAQTAKDIEEGKKLFEGMCGRG